MHDPDAATARRISELARKAGCAVEEMFQYVARDGLIAATEDIREAAAANAELDAGRGVSHVDAMRRGRAIIERHARKQKRAP